MIVHSARVTCYPDPNGFLHVSLCVCVCVYIYVRQRGLAARVMNVFWARRRERSECNNTNTQSRDTNTNILTEVYTDMRRTYMICHTLMPNKWTVVVFITGRCRLVNIYSTVSLPKKKEKLGWMMKRKREMDWGRPTFMGYVKQNTVKSNPRMKGRFQNRE